MRGVGSSGLGMLEVILVRLLERLVLRDVEEGEKPGCDLVGNALRPHCLLVRADATRRACAALSCQTRRRNGFKKCVEFIEHTELAGSVMVSSPVVPRYSIG